jgi:hypothetical protein
MLPEDHSDLTSLERRSSVCCAEFKSAIDVSFANYRDDETGWFLFGTDHDSAIGGTPEITFWVIRYCPFCGGLLERPVAVPHRGPAQES